jgi:hypothetical protein
MINKRLQKPNKFMSAVNNDTETIKFERNFLLPTQTVERYCIQTLFK